MRTIARLRSKIASGTFGKTYPPDLTPIAMIVGGGVVTQLRQNVFIPGKRVYLNEFVVVDPSNLTRGNRSKPRKPP
jgi:hypothetical protein